MDMGRIGIWTSAFEQQPWSAAAEAVAELDELGYGAIWYPEGRGRDTFAQAAMILNGTKRIVAAPGIANLYARDAMGMASGQRTICEAFPERFLLGIGVSHRPAVEGVRGQTYGPPLTTMRKYLDAMDAAPYAPPYRGPDETRVLAALGPKMLELSRDRAQGAHPYFVPPEHTELARKILGTGPILAPEQAVVLERDPGKAREIARTHVPNYLRLENYSNNLRRLGFSEDDLAGAGTDKLVDAIVAWGSLEDVIKRVQAHLDAGADHVCIQVLTATPREVPMPEWRELAAALLA